MDIIIPCGSSTLVDPVVSGGTFPYSYLWNTLQTDSVLALDTGTYYLTVTDTFGCFGIDTLEVIYDPPPLIDFIFDGLPFDALLDTDIIACNSTNFYGPVSIVGGTSPFTYEWKDASGIQLGILDSILLGDGTYYLTVTDTFGCFGVDTLEVIYDSPPTAEVKGAGLQICDDGIEEAKVVFTFNGLPPWAIEFTDGVFNYLQNNIIDTSYTYVTMNGGLYTIVMARDSNDCLSINSGSAEVVVYTLPLPIITPEESTLYSNESVELVVGDYEVYDWYLLPSLESIAISPTLTVSDSGNYYVTVRDTNGCENFSDVAIVNLQPYTDLFIPNSFTPNGDEHNELFVIKGGYILEFYIQIYNRWGEQLFESNDINKSWDGFYENNLIPEGSYYYHLRVLGEDKRVVEKSGSINVIY
jgi:gliding motility-associated-like protein